MNKSRGKVTEIRNDVHGKIYIKEAERFLYFNIWSLLNKDDITRIKIDTPVKFFIGIGSRGFRADEVEIIEEEG